MNLPLIFDHIHLTKCIFRLSEGHLIPEWINEQTEAHWHTWMYFGINSSVSPKSNSKWQSNNCTTVLLFSMQGKFTSI